MKALDKEIWGFKIRTIIKMLRKANIKRIKTYLKRTETDIEIFKENEFRDLEKDAKRMKTLIGHELKRRNI